MRRGGSWGSVSMQYPGVLFLKIVDSVADSVLFVGCNQLLAIHVNLLLPRVVVWAVTLPTDLVLNLAVWTNTVCINLVHYMHRARLQVGT